MAGEETEAERLDRKLIELLNEIRIVLPGAQVLFAFLLILPFNSGFRETTHLQRDVYAASLVCAAVSSMLLIAPSSYHRHRFPRLRREGVEGKQEMIATQSRLVVGGIFFLTLAMMGSIYVTLDVLLGVGAAALAVLLLGAGYGWFWYGLPLSRRVRDAGRAPGGGDPSP